MPKNARELAWETLSRWSVLADPPRMPERDDPAWTPVPARDRAQAFDMISGVIRWRGLLDAVLGPFLKDPRAVGDKVRAVLWIGAYQLLIQESGKAYAAVDEAVELCKIRAEARAAGLVNGVLRNLLRAEPKAMPRAQGSAMRFPRDGQTDVVFNRALLPEPEKSLAAYLGAATSHPVEFVKMLLGQQSAARALEILAADNRRPAILLRCDDPGFSPAKKTGLLRHEATEYFAAAEGWNEAIAELVKGGVLSPQDPTAGLAADKLAELLAKDALVCDLCAGMGTKTVQLARQLTKGRVIATDIDFQKLSKLKIRAEETKLKNVETAGVGTVAGKGPFDAVLIDAPCSNSGVFARRVQARWRWPKLDIAAMTRLQLKLLNQAVEMAKPGGLIAYATCSVDAAENGLLVQRFLEGAARKAVMVAEQMTWPAQEHDGGYFALLKV